MKHTTDTERKLTAFMADFFQQFGASTTLGRLLGLLMAHREPLSLEELAEKSGLSKGSVSVHMRSLEQFEYCRKLPPGSDRRSYYLLEENFVATSYRRRLETQLRMLDRLTAVRDQLAKKSSPESKDAESNAAVARLETLAQFQTMSAESSNRLLKDWSNRSK